MDDMDDYELELSLSLSQSDGFSEKLDNDLDYAIALSLQAEFNNESTSTVDAVKFNTDKSSNKLATGNANYEARKPSSIVDEEWEVLDPIPDIHSLFLQFNDEYFWGKLDGVEVRWSPRMTLCAGVCSYDGRGGLCSVRLSQPLLKYRPRRDLIETLLHEMIHAYLFVTHNNKDHDGHGPEFLKHMNRINCKTGTKISVYHSFHDEVDMHRKHWWKCNGPCQHQRPFFGLVKRAMNRAPSSRDPWWAAHKAKCGGTYTKIKEPENFGQKKSTKRKIDSDACSEKAPQAKDIRNFFSSTSPVKPNIHTYSEVKDQKKTQIIPFSGKGFTLGTGNTKNTNPRNSVLVQKGLFTRPAETSSSSKPNTKKPKFNIPSASKGFPTTKGRVIGGGTSTAFHSGGSKTIVLNKTPKSNEKPETAKTKGNEKKPNYFKGTGHILGESSTSKDEKAGSTNSPSKVKKQKSIEIFFGSPSPAGSKSVPKKKTVNKNLAFIFSSDSEEEIEVLRTVKPTKSSIIDDNAPRNETPNDCVHCPVCQVQINSAIINFHLDSCLKNLEQNL